MKALSKPLSSPGRADKFPPPLMRFLRSNVGSRSRGRSRTSPLFYLRSRKSALPIETTQEPSSPKVTCIGQVRVRRRAKKSNRRRRRAWWRPRGKPSFCGGWFRRPFRRLFCKCCLVFRFGYYSKKVNSKEDSFRVHSDKVRETRNDAVLAVNVVNMNFSSNATAEIDCNKKGFPALAPKNALLLTRCRSAPYRSSSLAGRFWGSPLGDSEAEIEEKLEELVKPRISEESNKELGNSAMEKDEELKGSNGGEGERTVRPLVLTRCKSEPARTGERLIQESNFPRLNS